MMKEEILNSWLAYMSTTRGNVEGIVRVHAPLQPFTAAARARQHNRLQSSDVPVARIYPPCSVSMMSVFEFYT